MTARPTAGRENRSFREVFCIIGMLLAFVDPADYYSTSGFSVHDGSFLQDRLPLNLGQKHGKATSYRCKTSLRGRGDLLCLSMMKRSLPGYHTFDPKWRMISRLSQFSMLRRFKRIGCKSLRIMKLLNQVMRAC